MHIYLLLVVLYLWTEMVCFILDRTIQIISGHGPEFQSHMNRINSLAGTSITIFHSFHAEV